MEDVLKEFREYLGEIDVIVEDQLQIARNRYLNKTLTNLESRLDSFIKDGLVYDEVNARIITTRIFNYGITRFSSLIKGKNNEYLHQMDKFENVDEQVFNLISAHYDEVFLEVKRLDISSSFDDVKVRTSNEIVDDIKQKNRMSKLYETYYQDIKYEVRKSTSNDFEYILDDAKEEIIRGINSVFENFKDDLYRTKDNNQTEGLDTSVFDGGKKLVKALPGRTSSEEVVESLPIDGIFK